MTIYNVLSCIQWLQNPKIDPMTRAKITNINIFSDICKSVMTHFTPEEIYELNVNIFNIL